jgi:hypothetical protein
VSEAIERVTHAVALYLKYKVRDKSYFTYVEGKKSHGVKLGKASHGFCRERLNLGFAVRYYLNVAVVALFNLTFGGSANCCGVVESGASAGATMRGG